MRRNAPWHRMTAKGEWHRPYHADRQTARTAIASEHDREIDQGCFRIGDIRRRKTLGIAKIELDMTYRTWKWADELRHAFGL